MLGRPDTAQFKYILSADARERIRALACNRILLYGRGMELSAESCLELATECLHRSPENADLKDIMAIMHKVIDERAMDPMYIGGDAVPRQSVPPLNRRTMVSRGESYRSFLGWIANGIVWLAGIVSFRLMPWRRRKA